MSQISVLYFYNAKVNDNYLHLQYCLHKRNCGVNCEKHTNNNTMTGSTTSSRSVFTSITSRNFAACLMALITSVIMIPGMSTYLPFSAVDQIGLPIFMFPFIWTALFIYSYMSSKTWHPWALMFGLAVIHGVLCFLALTGGK